MRSVVILLSTIFGVVPSIAAAQNMPDQCERMQTSLDSNKLVVIQGYMSGHVVTGKGRLYFHSAPSGKCKTEVFIIPGDTVDVVEQYGAFSNASYINPKNGNTTAGWIESNRLKPNGLGLTQESDETTIIMKYNKPV
jgi:hypothetical protein